MNNRQIKRKRKKLQNSIEKYGLLSNKTQKISRELDELIIKAYKK